MLFCQDLLGSRQVETPAEVAPPLEMFKMAFNIKTWYLRVALGYEKLHLKLFSVLQRLKAS